LDHIYGAMMGDDLLLGVSGDFPVQTEEPPDIRTTSSTANLACA